MMGTGKEENLVVKVSTLKKVIASIKESSKMVGIVVRES